jgi:lipopolysaccharide export system permease protein
VFKKLDILIIKAFIGPFVATFFITLFVLIMQFFWLYIDDFVSKGLGTDLILEFIWYLSATLVPLALPLAILLSSLMTFGNLGESFELVAIKSAGISLLRFMRPLFFVTVLLSGVAFIFSNYIIPVATLKQRTLLGDIVYAKPAFDLKEGVFYDKIPNFAIKIGKKEENDSVIRDVIVYEQGNALQDNFIIARSGIMRVSDNKRFLEFNLKDGWRYQERGSPYSQKNAEYIRIGFQEYKKQFDLSTLGFSNRTADSVNKNNEKMLSMRQLNVAIDSLAKQLQQTKEQNLANIFLQFRFTTLLDYNWVKIKTAGKVVKKAADTLVKKDRDSVAKNANDTTGGKKVKIPVSFDEILPDSARINVNQSVQNIAGSLKSTAESIITNLKDGERNLRKHKIEWHRKIVLSLACLVLFMVGAPLGSIIRKGGLGTPLIFAIIFFMVFYFSSTTGEKFAKEDSLSPFTGMWLATFVLVPVGVFLTYKAMRDSQLFNKEKYAKIARIFRRGKKETKA